MEWKGATTKERQKVREWRGEKRGEGAEAGKKERWRSPSAELTMDSPELPPMRSEGG